MACLLERGLLNIDSNNKFPYCLKIAIVIDIIITITIGYH